MESHVIMLIVNEEQEEAIRSMFVEKRWTFYKTGSRSPLEEELNHLNSLQRKHAANGTNAEGRTSIIGDTDSNSCLWKGMIRSHPISHLLASAPDHHVSQKQLNTETAFSRNCNHDIENSEPKPCKSSSFGNVNEYPCDSHSIDRNDTNTANPLDPWNDTNTANPLDPEKPIEELNLTKSGEAESRKVLGEPGKWESDSPTLHKKFNEDKAGAGYKAHENLFHTNELWHKGNANYSNLFKLVQLLMMYFNGHKCTFKPQEIKIIRNLIMEILNICKDSENLQNAPNMPDEAVTLWRTCHTTSIENERVSDQYRGQTKVRPQIDVKETPNKICPKPVHQPLTRSKRTYQHEVTQDEISKRSKRIEDKSEICGRKAQKPHSDNTIDTAQRNYTAKKLPKRRWSLNRNMRLHACHKKCKAIPQDLTSDQFSPSQNGYYCEDCKFIFNEKNKLVLHKTLRNGLCSSLCIYCDKDDLKKIFQCHLCPKCFSRQSLLNKHIARHSRRFKCILCENIAFYTVQDLKLHQSKFHAEELKVEYLCDLCGAKFHDKKILNGHRKFVHTENRPEQCGTCQMRFKTKSQLSNHELCHRTVSDIHFSCEVCGKQFMRAGSLKDHVRRHNKEYREFCNICKKGFYRKHGLESHMRTHTGEKPYCCTVCGFKTALSGNLIKHMKTHKTPAKKAA